MVRVGLTTLGLVAAGCVFPSYFVERERESGGAGMGGSVGGTTQSVAGGGSGAVATGGVGPAASGGEPSGGDASSGDGGQGGGAAADPLLSVDLRGNCLGGVPTGEGQTEVVSVLSAYDVTAYGVEVGHHCGQDQGRFAYVEVSGDFDVAVQLTAMSNSDAVEGTLGNPVKAGLMLREDLTPTARYVAILAVEPQDKFPDCFVFDYRSKVGSALGVPGFDYGWLNRDDAIDKRQLPNVWVRLKREGNELSAFASEDGASWLSPSRSSWATDLASHAYLGIVASSAVEGGVNARSLTSFRNLRGFDELLP